MYFEARGQRYEGQSWALHWLFEASLVN